MKKLFITVSVLIGLIFFGYLVLPNPTFPTPPPDALQSNEPADTETPLRRAYFTNYDRQQVLDWYKSQFEKSSFLGIPLPTYLLNYPPEDAQTIIRDQTRSSYLQEVVHPFRESVFINGFGAASAKDTIFIGGVVWKEKITVRFVPSSMVLRVLIFAGTVGAVYFLFEAYRKVLNFKHE